MTVVMDHGAAKDAFEMSLIDDKEMIQAFGTDGSHKSFGIRVGIRRPKRRLEDLGTF